MLHSGMVLAAPQSGSGKTTITCALLAAMKNLQFVRSKADQTILIPCFTVR